MEEIVFDVSTTASIQLHSCEECRIRKSKCDRRMPCSNCKRKGRQCVYGHVRRTKSQKKYTVQRSAGRSRSPAISSRSNHQGSHRTSIGPSEILGPDVWNYSGDVLAAQNIPSSNTIATHGSPRQDVSTTFPAYSLFDVSLEWPLATPAELHSGSSGLPLSDFEIERTVAMYLYQIHPSTPFFSASFLLDGLKFHRHRNDQAFAAMVLALCAFVCTHPRGASPPFSATDMLSQALHLHQVPNLGEAPTVEVLLTSMFISGTLWRMGKENASWLRLQEAICFARLLQLLDLEHDHILDPKTWENMTRVYLGLSVAERVYASCSQYRPPSLLPVSPILLERFSQRRPNTWQIGALDESNQTAALCLLMQFIGLIDEGVSSCLRGECGSVAGQLSSCTRISRDTISKLLQDTTQLDLNEWQHFNQLQTSAKVKTMSLKSELETVGLVVDGPLSENEYADILLTCLWVQNRLWNLGFTHGYILGEPASPELSFQFAIYLARKSLNLFKDFSIHSWESHHEGVAEKFSSIASDFLVAAIHLLTQRVTHETSYRDLRSLNAGGPEYLPSDFSCRDTSSFVEIANGFLGFFSLFRGGQTPYYTEYMTSSFYGNCLNTCGFSGVAKISCF